MKRFWLWLARVFARWGDAQIFFLPEDLGPAVDVAYKLVRELSHVDASGEWKRHQVYATMIKIFEKPLKEGKIRRRHLALVIEVAINAAPGR